MSIFDSPEELKLYEREKNLKENLDELNQRFNNLEGIINPVAKFVAGGMVFTGVCYAFIQSENFHNDISSYIIGTITVALFAKFIHKAMKYSSCGDQIIAMNEELQEIRKNPLYLFSYE